MMITFEEIKKALPQKYPFLMIDGASELEEGKNITCFKVTPPNHTKTAHAAHKSKADPISG